jgi:hypothetical protein
LYIIIEKSHLVILLYFTDVSAAATKALKKGVGPFQQSPTSNVNDGTPKKVTPTRKAGRPKRTAADELLNVPNKKKPTPSTVVQPPKMHRTIEGPSLQDLGLKVATTKPICPPLNANNQSKLCAAIVRNDVGGCSIVFRCESCSPLKDSWSEKVFMDAIDNKATWITRLGISSDVVKWYEYDTIQTHVSAFGIRMFMMHLETIPTNAVLCNLGQLICDSINNTEGNKSVLFVDKLFLFGIAMLSGTI